MGNSPQTTTYYFGWGMKVTENRFSYLSVWLPEELPTEGRVADIPNIVVFSKAKISSRQQLFKVIGKGEGEDSLRSTCTQRKKQ